MEWNWIADEVRYVLLLHSHDRALVLATASARGDDVLLAWFVPAQKGQLTVVDAPRSAVRSRLDLDLDLDLHANANALAWHWHRQTDRGMSDLNE